MALFSDVHASWEKLDKLIGIINFDNYDLAVFLGDLTNLGDPNDLKLGKELLEKLKIPYFIMPGNHDIWYARHFGQPAESYWQEAFPASLSPTCSTQKNFNLVFVDNADEQTGIAEENWQQLLDCLAVNKPALLFSHEPLNHPANERVMGQYSAAVATQAASLRQLICDYRVKLAVAGHLHSFAKYNYACISGYQLPMIVAGAATSERNFQSPRFLELNVFTDGTFEEKEIVLP